MLLEQDGTVVHEDNVTRTSRGDAIVTPKSHNEALAMHQHKIEDSGDLFALFETAGLTEENRRVGPFDWNDPMDVFEKPVQKFLSTPQCLPMIVLLITACTITAASCLYGLNNDRSIEKTCMMVFEDKDDCSSDGLPFLYYFSVESPENVVFGVGGTIAALVHVVCFYFVTVSMHLRICTFSYEFPELVDGLSPLTNGGHLGCGGVVCCGWPGPSLRVALILQAAFAVCAGISLILLVWLNAADYYSAHRSMEVLFVLFSGLNAYLVVRIQITLNIVPEQDVRNFLHNSDESCPSARKEFEVQKIPYDVDDLLRRIKIKIFFVVFAAVELIVLACLDAVDWSSSTRLHVLPILQWVALLFYCVAYGSFVFDIRLGDVRWSDWYFAKHLKLSRKTEDSRSVDLLAEVKRKYAETEELEQPEEPIHRGCVPQFPYLPPSSPDGSVCKEDRPCLGLRSCVL